MRAYQSMILLAALFVAAGCGDDDGNNDDGDDGDGAAVCGDGQVGGTEECDDGNSIAGDGCDSCRFTCVSTDSTRGCISSDDECAGVATCNDDTHVCEATPLPDNESCAGGPNNYCLGGVCTAPTCGNGQTEPGEECDDGNAVAGDGCEQSRTFSCVSTEPARGCETSDDECAGVTACNDDTHTCETGRPRPNNESCSGGENNYCFNGVCTTPECGNDRTEPGEECDGQEACNPDCTVCEECEVVCGNGVRQEGEQCDDDNRLNLDGCDSECRFEQASRITSLVQQFGTDDVCPRNALGAAITEVGQDTIQATWRVPVSDGTLSIVFKFLDLTDLSGQNATFNLGFVNARAGGRTFAETPECGNDVCEEGPPLGGLTETVVTCPADCTYDGRNDLDWWYIRDRASVDENETPLVQLPGQIEGGVLTAGPGTISLQLLFALEPAQVTLFNALIQSTVDASSVNTPTISGDGAPPGHLPSENLAPDLTSFSRSSSGSMCSDVSVQSLHDTPLPLLLQVVCTDATGQNTVFTAENTLLDLFVVGCNLFGNGDAVLATQPDGSTDGADYRFEVNDSLTVSSCTRDGEEAELTECLSAASFSSYFTFGSDRVIIKRE